MSEEQTVVDTETETTSSEQVENAQDDYEAALKEYDASTKTETKTEPEKTPETKTTNDDVVMRLAQIEYERDIKPTIQTVRGELNAETFDDDYVETWLEAQARKDARVAQAWLNRAKDKAAWNKVSQALGKKFNEAHSKLTPKDDRDAVAAAVKSASTKQTTVDEGPNLKGMSDQAFARHKASLLSGAR